MDIINSNISIINTHVNESENKKLKKIKKNSKLSDDDFKILKPHEYNQIHICQYILLILR